MIDDALGGYLEESPNRAQIKLLREVVVSGRIAPQRRALGLAHLGLARGRTVPTGDDAPRLQFATGIVGAGNEL
jgi:hypothetical protein